MAFHDALQLACAAEVPGIERLNVDSGLAKLTTNSNDAFTGATVDVVSFLTGTRQKLIKFVRLQGASAASEGRLLDLQRHKVELHVTGYKSKKLLERLNLNIRIYFDQIFD